MTKEFERKLVKELKEINNVLNKNEVFICEQYHDIWTDEWCEVEYVCNN